MELKPKEIPLTLNLKEEFDLLGLKHIFKKFKDKYNEEQLKEMEERIKFLQMHNKKQSRKKQREKRIKCNICNCTMYYNHQYQHLKTKKHIKNII